MKNNLPKKWIRNLRVLDVAFQPIINIHTGKIFAVEALLRNYQEAGYGSIFELFDDVYKDNLLYSFDIKLRKKTFKKFITIDGYKDIKLFYNLDNRVLEMPNFKNGNTIKLLKKYSIDKSNICFEISERHQFKNHTSMEELLYHYKNEDFCIAIDDFGVGYSGYKLLYDSKPDIIKIDRFFLTDIQKDIKKKLMVRSITHLAIQLGIKIIAEGIETKEELFACKDIGCHFIQGYLIQKPTLNIDEIEHRYSHIVHMISNDKRVSNGDYQIETYLEKKASFSIDTDISKIVQYFQKKADVDIVTIVNSSNEPIGILQGSKIKEFIYSSHGKALLISGRKKLKLKNLILPCGVAEISSNMSIIIEIFSNTPESLGIILTNNSSYYGFLSARAIITIMNEQNLLFAREQNPLTKLPGNSMIEKYMGEISKNNYSYILCYFDLNHFKAFNDVYGFRNGDRAIQLFADILRKNLQQDFFKGHIGGDDFFVAIESDKDNEDRHIKNISAVTKKFADDARELYSKEDKERGCIITTDRDGSEKIFTLLSVSASLLIVRDVTTKRNADYINEILTSQKKAAKKEANHISISCML